MVATNQIFYCESLFTLVNKCVFASIAFVIEVACGLSQNQRECTCYIFADVSSA